MNALLLECYRDRIAGGNLLRPVIAGTLPGVYDAEGMTNFLNANHIRFFGMVQIRKAAAID